MIRYTKPHHGDQDPGFDEVAQNELANAVIGALVSATEGRVDVRHEDFLLSPGRRLDLFLRLKVDGQHVDFAIELVRDAYPRDVASAIAHVQSFAPKDRVPVIHMVAANTLSKGARDLLRENGIGYFDLQGNLYIRWRRWLIDVRTQNVKTSSRKSAASKAGLDLFTDARACVVHAILHATRHHANPWLGVQEIAQMAGTSDFTCSKVLQELEKREWCEAEGTGPARRRRLVQPNALLDAWCEAWPPNKEKRTHWYCFVPPKAGALQQKLRSLVASIPDMITWAYSGAAPANMITPLLTAVTDAEIIIPPGQTDLVAGALGVDAATKGYNLTIVERDSASLLFREAHGDGTWSASPYILYLDLMHGPGRNKELAANLRQQLELATDV
ncbi:hypothetical protein DWU98_16340 [Dyella monticola]|uniref:Uncharacterized protein n=1 Tax=Dyella monticola TaxID=1927958 RepID=A0A370WU10_9GAMM|nr:type IV toxin-antitoxin system AbiEi family antitoxin [Dyella monticola]RDS79638.1 hypothetical protein DWU98_16340 [Dyella monticola]